MVPPMLLHLRFGAPGRPGLWLPLFLLWLIVLPVAVLVLLIAMAADAVLFLVGASYHRTTLVLLRCLGVLAASRGTSVRVRAGGRAVDIELV